MPGSCPTAPAISIYGSRTAVRPGPLVLMGWKGKGFAFHAVIADKNSVTLECAVW